MPLIRTADPADYDAIVTLIDDWWGRPVAGAAPHARRLGYGRLLYQEFFDRARAAGRTFVSAVTAPANQRSAAFHRALGFTVTGPVADYNGPGRHMITFWREL